jgi:hypothetical protein
MVYYRQDLSTATALNSVTHARSRLLPRNFAPKIINRGGRRLEQLLLALEDQLSERLLNLLLVAVCLVKLSLLHNQTREGSEDSVGQLIQPQTTLAVSVLSGKVIPLGPQAPLAALVNLNHKLNHKLPRLSVGAEHSEQRSHSSNNNLNQVPEVSLVTTMHLPSENLLLVHSVSAATIHLGTQLKLSPAGAPATTGFGGTGAFGQTQQPQQNTSVFGTTTQPQQGSAFGGFGASTSSSRYLDYFSSVFKITMQRSHFSERHNRQQERLGAPVADYSGLPTTKPSNQPSNQLLVAFLVAQILQVAFSDNNRSRIRLNQGRLIAVSGCSTCFTPVLFTYHVSIR